MPASTPRTRLIFQNLNLYVGPLAQSGNTATGQMYTSGNSGINLIAELAHVQSATLNVTMNRTDVQIFGQLARIDNIIINPPTINLDFSYLPNDGYNESIMGLSTQGNSFLSGILTKATDSKNYFIGISQQGVDADAVSNPNQLDTYAIGNGFISNYTFNAAVNQVTTASVTIDALAVSSYTGSSGLQTPAVDPNTSNPITTWTFQLPSGVVNPASSISALKPGDITLTFPNGLGFLVPLSGQNMINIESVSISVPISREILNRLGSPFGFSREINFPVDCSMQIRAKQTEVQPNSLASLICSDAFYNMSVLLRQPGCQQTGNAALILAFNQAKMTSISNGFTIGGDATVDISATCQMGGATSTNGFTFSGFYPGSTF